MYIEYRYRCTGIILKENYIRCDPADCSLRQSVIPISSVTIQHKWTIHELLFGENISKGTMDPGADCFDR